MRYYQLFFCFCTLLVVGLVGMAPLHAQEATPTKSFLSSLKSTISISDLRDKLTSVPALNNPSTPTSTAHTIKSELAETPAIQLVSAEKTITATESITSTPTPSAESISFGTICINSFSDEDASGIRDANEGYMAGIPVMVKREGKIVTQGISTGTQQPVCFAELVPGEYEVLQQPPASLALTTANNAMLTLKAGQTIGLEFGSRIRPMPTGTPIAPTETVTMTPSIPVPPVPSSNELSPIVWITVLSVLVVGIGGSLIALLRR